MLSTAPPPSPFTSVWHEFGRPSPEQAQDWTTWVSPSSKGGDALYRSLVITDGAAEVTVELHSRHRSGSQTLHRDRCGLPPDPEQTTKRVRLLLEAADTAVARAVEAGRSREGAAAGCAGPSSRRVPDAPRNGKRDEGVPAAPHERGDHSRGHAGRGAATAS